MLGPDQPRFICQPTPASPSPDGGPLSPQQAAAVRKFVAQVGGLENARNALELLTILSAAGQAPPKSAR
jgi:cell division septation protein DedD